MIQWEYSRDTVRRMRMRRVEEEEEGKRKRENV